MKMLVAVIALITNQAYAQVHIKDNPSNYDCTNDSLGEIAIRSLNDESSQDPNHHVIDIDIKRQLGRDSNELDCAAILTTQGGPLLGKLYLMNGHVSGNMLVGFDPDQYLTYVWRLTNQH